MQEFGKLIAGLGLILVLLGLLLWSGVGKNWIARLPGDIHWEKDGSSFHFPIVTCLLLSAVLSLLSWLVSKFK